MVAAVSVTARTRARFAVSALILGACSGGAQPQQAIVLPPAQTDLAGVQGVTDTPAVMMVGSAGMNSSAVAAMTGVAGGVGGAGGSAGDMEPASAHDHGAMAGSGAAADPLAQCKLHITADARDAMLTNDPQMVQGLFDQDAILPKIVLDWMDENQVSEAHDGWHLARKWDQTCRMSNATSNCAAAASLTSQGLQRAPIQQGAPGDGVAFMMMHRHMIMMLNTAFPTHPKVFQGFTKVPKSTNDPENPHPWHTITWTSSNMQGFDILENIEQHLDQFPTDDDLGQFIENTYRWTAQSPTSPVSTPGAGVHGALHSQWSVTGSPADLIDQSVDVKNYAFWKLHGWIDTIWARYRKAKGLTDDEPAYQKLMLEQCNEMFALEPRNRGMSGSGPSTGTGGTSAPETGEFATMVRPFLDNTCGGCHSPVAPNAGMTLGGKGISSKDVIAGLVGVKATNGEYNLIEPGQPHNSWVYLKASGEVASVACSQACNRESMPPAGTGLTQAQLMSLSQWIMNGATDK